LDSRCFLQRHAEVEHDAKSDGPSTHWSGGKLCTRRPAFELLRRPSQMSPV